MSSGDQAWFETSPLPPPRVARPNGGGSAPPHVGPDGPWRPRYGTGRWSGARSNSAILRPRMSAGMSAKRHRQSLIGPCDRAETGRSFTPRT